MTDKPASAPRCAAIVGPYLSGKTALFESLLHAAGAIPKKGSVKDGSTVGDGAAEARGRKMSTELTPVTADYLGESWTFLDCPGSIELAQEAQNALMVCDAAIVVCEPATDRAVTLAPVLKFIDDHEIPHILFVNKMDEAQERLRDLMEALQAASPRPLVLREVPIREGEEITGFVDLVSERAYRYREGQPSALIRLPEAVQEREQSARTELLEKLADFDDGLLEQLLEDVVPPPEAIYDNLTRDLQSRSIVPVFFGSAESSHGVVRLLKALRHEAPGPDQAAARLGAAAAEDAAVQLFKTWHQPHTGKISLGRVLAGDIRDGMTLNGERVSGLYRVNGQQQDKLDRAGVGEVVGLGRMDRVRTGDLLTASGKAPDGAPPWPAPLPPLYALKIAAEQRTDEVKLTGSLAKLSEEDPSLRVEHDQDAGELLLWGQGEIHLQIALERLARKNNLAVTSRRPQVAYKETIRKPVSQHARFKRQSGGHGQFGDVHIDIRPLPRGSGFAFEDKVVGGAVPHQFIPSVEAGVKDFMQKGPFGFPVVDVAVTLADGQHHAVDSSDAAFRTAGRMAMAEGMPKCDPVLLEPIYRVSVAAPSEFTSKVQRLLSSRRGQILGFDARDGWSNWEEMTAYLPQSEMHDLIIELRSLTLGIGSYSWEFDRLQELTGKLAEQVIAGRADAA